MYILQKFKRAIKQTNKKKTNEVVQVIHECSKYLTV